MTEATPARLAEIVGHFTDVYDQCPARWFDTVAAAHEYAEYLLKNSVSFQMAIVKRKKSRPRVVMVYLGAWIPRGADHIVPRNDLREHYPTVDCLCGPKYDEDCDAWVHNALDQRELYERGELLPC